MVETGGSRTKVLDAIEARRRSVDQYLAEKRPINARLTRISVASSCIAAALTAGPAIGGETFAQTVQNGLSLSLPQTVWRVLCFVAVVVSITAAIATNLSKSSDLASRIAAAEAANGALDGLQMRLQVGLAAGEAAQQYQEIITHVPWIQGSAGPPGPEDTSRQRQRPRLAAPYLVATVGVGALIVVITLGGLLAGLAHAAPSTSSSSTDRSAPTAAPTPTSSPTTGAASYAVGSAVYSGHTANGVGIAVAIDGGKAAAYVCDGNSLEAWLQGSFDGHQVALSSKSGASLTGSMSNDGSELDASFIVQEHRYSTVMEQSDRPAGVYEARIASPGKPDIRIGWAVLESGASLGVTNDGGIEVPAPVLNRIDYHFNLRGHTYFATLKSSPDTIIDTQ